MFQSTLFGSMAAMRVAISSAASGASLRSAREKSTRSPFSLEANGLAAGFLQGRFPLSPDGIGQTPKTGWRVRLSPSGPEGFQLMRVAGARLHGVSPLNNRPFMLHTGRAGRTFGADRNRT